MVRLERQTPDGRISMAKTTIIFGLILIALGILGYTGAETSPTPTEPDTVAAGESAAEAADVEKPKKSVTALIPAFVGAIIAVCGVVALSEGMRMHAMHGAVLVGLLGCLAGLGRGGGHPAATDPNRYDRGTG